MNINARLARFRLLCLALFYIELTSFLGVVIELSTNGPLRLLWFFNSMDVVDNLTYYLLLWMIIMVITLYMPFASCIHKRFHKEELDKQV